MPVGYPTCIPDGIFIYIYISLYVFIYLYIYIYIFRFSTCFEQPCAHHQESQLYQYNIWYMSICVGDHPVCRSDTRPAYLTVSLYIFIYLYMYLYIFIYFDSLHVASNFVLIIRKVSCINTTFGICHSE